MTPDTPNLSEIVARLREYSRTFDIPVFAEAADLIEQLQRDHDLWDKHKLVELVEKCEQLQRELAAANARIAELETTQRKFGKMQHEFMSKAEATIAAQQARIDVAKRWTFHDFWKCDACKLLSDPSDSDIISKERLPCSCGLEAWLSTPPAVSTTTTSKSFVRSDTDDSSTLDCPCGATFTWWGAANEGLDEWQSKHKPHLSTPPAGDKHGPE